MEDEQHTAEIAPRGHSLREALHVARRNLTLIVLLGLGIVGLGGAIGYLYLETTQLASALEATRTEQHEAFETLTNRLASTTETLRTSLSEQADLIGSIQRDQEVTSRSLAREIERVTGTVSDLEKLSQVDARLLQKYSKVFFLNEHYEPERLVSIDTEYLSDENRTQRFHAQAWPFLRNLLKAAARDNIELKIVSAYRSFNEQGNIKSGYTVQYGAGTANTFSADQGYSEHQLGTTIDFTTEGLNGGLDGFQDTKAYQWLLKNAYRYGFVLSYPPGNQYYLFEPWHWRFVGVDLANDLRRKKEFFYDWSQRDIDEYLLKLFD